MARLEMEGLAELQRNLARFAQTEREQVENKALAEAGEYLREKIQGMTRVRTGALKAAIIKGEVIEGKIQIGPSQQGPAFRAHFVEFGTSHSKAQPFMRPAFEVSKDRLIQIMSAEIRRGLRL